MKSQGLQLTETSDRLKTGFNISSEGLNYYGIKDYNNNISVLCFYGADSDKDLVNSIDKVSKMLATENLYLVDGYTEKSWTRKKHQRLFYTK